MREKSREDQSDAIYNISEGEEDAEELTRSIQTLNIHHESIFMLGQVDGGYRPRVRVTDEQLNCIHTWRHNMLTIYGYLIFW